MTDDEMMSTAEFKAGTWAHGLGATVDELLSLKSEDLEPVFESLIVSQLALNNLIIRHLRWRVSHKRKSGTNERMVQIRH